MTCFLSSITVGVSSPHEPHTDIKPPFVFHSLTLTFSNLLLTATVPSSCHPSRIYLLSTLLSIRIITKLFYQIFHIHLGPLQIFLGLVLRPLFSFRSVKLIFSSCFVAVLLFFCPQKTARPEMTIAASTFNVQVSYIFPSI